MKKMGGWIKMDNNAVNQILNNIDQVEELYSNTPDGRIIDSDTILADLIEKADFEVTYESLELFDIFKNTTDKQAFLEMFYFFTDTPFEKYLAHCIEKTTRKENGDEQ